MTIPRRDLREDAPEDWSSDGHWQGPHDIRVFLRHNRFFATFWFVVAAPIGGAMFMAFMPLEHTYALPLAIPVGIGFWWLFMFLFSHGLIAEGD